MGHVSDPTTAAFLIQGPTAWETIFGGDGRAACTGRRLRRAADMRRVIAVRRSAPAMTGNRLTQGQLLVEAKLLLHPGRYTQELRFCKRIADELDGERHAPEANRARKSDGG